MLRKGLGLIITVWLTWQASAQSDQYLRDVLSAPEYAPGQLLVKFQPSLSDGDKTLIRHLMGAHLLRVNTWLGYELWQVNPYADVPQLCEELLKTGWLADATPNWRVELADWTPNDPYFPQQSALSVINAPQGWDYWRGDSNFIMAILDTGVNRTHPDLQARLLPGYDFGGDSNGVPDNDPSDFHGHGTFVTGIAGAVTNNATGIAAVAPLGKVLPVKVFRDNGQGFLVSILDGMTYAVAQGAHAINLSLGGTTPNTVWETIINSTWNAGVVVVAAAGNNNSTSPFYPAWYSNCIAVAACNLDRTRSSVSNYGSWVDMAAPSGDVWSTTRTGGYSRNQGGYTSYAAPFVTAQAVLIYSLIADSPSDRSVTRAQTVRQVIESTALPVPGNYVANGMLNIEGSILRALTIPVGGRIAINGVAGSLTGRTVEVQVRPLNGTTPIASNTATTNSVGDFTAEVFLQPSQLGYRDLAIRAQGTLFKRVQNQRMRYPGVSGLNLTLTPGDVNGDNQIDDADLLEVLFNFGQTGSNPADIDSSGIVDDADLLLVLFNFGQVGE